MSLFANARHRGWLAVLVVLLTVAAGVAEARPGRGGGGFGSRGARTFDAPAPTATAPRTASPIDRSATAPNRTSSQATPAQGRPGFFGNRGGFMGGLMGGLLGAGLFGLLLGHGFMGGFAGLASVFGFLLQIGLIALLVMLAFRFFRSRQPGYAGAGQGHAYSGPTPQPGSRGGPLGGLGGLGLGTKAERQRPRGGDAIGLTQSDFDSFERLLGTVQTAYGREDMTTLERHATPEMSGYLAEELAQNASRGVRNVTSDAKLLQGDLSEAWREGDREYATVALRFSLKDYEVDRQSGQVRSGDGADPVETTEIWTFMRPRGGSWVLSAIQQG